MTQIHISNTIKIKKHTEVQHWLQTDGMNHNTTDVSQEPHPFW